MTIELKIKGNTEGLRLKDFVPGELEYGEYDEAFRLVEAKDESSVIVFDPKHIGRGVNTEIKEDGVDLGLSLPAPKEEVKLIYKLAKRVLKKLGISSFVKGESVKKLADIESLTEEGIKESEEALKEISEKLSAQEGKIATIFGALNPISMTAGELQEMDGSLAKLGKFLHEKLSVNAWYCAPQFFEDPSDGGVIGVYNIMAEVDSIMPFEASTPFYMEGEVKQWYVYVYMSDQQYGYVPFDVFSARAPKQGLYDADHYFITLSGEQAEQLIKNYGAEV